MDLNQLDTVSACEAGLPLTIKDVNGNDTDIVITVRGVDSKVFKTENAKLQARIKAAERRGSELDADEQEADYCRLMAICTTGWTNLEHNGKAVPFSTDKAAEIYAGFPLIKAQVFAALFDRAAFLGNFAGASSNSSEAKRS